MTNKTLHSFLADCARKYYNGEESPIADEVYDRLAASIGFSTLGAKPNGKVARHLYPMYSLDKHYPEDGGLAPLNEYPDNEKTTSPKFDGAAGDLLYVDGVLVQALTRGDGLEGQDITEKVQAYQGLVPLTINNPKSQILQVTGEFTAPSHVENARNYAAGALNLKDVNEFRTRALTFIAYGVQPYPTNDYVEDMKYLKRVGFTTVHDRDLYKIYPTDGMVCRIRSNAEFVRLGYTANFPKGAYAIKERAEAVETTLLAVEWQVNKTGRVTPVAILEPVMIGDAKVSRATLNNPGFIETLGIEIGDKVLVIRAGEVIPCVLGRAEQ